MDFSAKIVNCEKTDNKDRETRDDIRNIQYGEVKMGSTKSKNSEHGSIKLVVSESTETIVVEISLETSKKFLKRLEISLDYTHLAKNRFST